MGSQFALADILASAGAKKTVCLNQNGLPRLYENFAYGREFLSAEDFDDLDDPDDPDSADDPEPAEDQAADPDSDSDLEDDDPWGMKDVSRPHLVR